jgi:hypothetical protein
MITKSQPKISKPVHPGGASGVFRYLVNHAAFVDKVVLNVWGVRRKRPSSRIKGSDNLAIGGPGRFYARCLPRHHRLSGNDLQVRYGLLKPFANLSPYTVTAWSVKSPLTCADVFLVLDGLFRRGYKAVISSAEMTFDTEGIPMSRFRRELCSRARVRTYQDQSGKVTVYVGGSRSQWELRLYEKTDSVVRIEFVLRSAILRAHNIRRPQDLLLLKKAKLWRKVGFREVNLCEASSLPVRLQEGWEARGLTAPPMMPARVMERELRQARVNPVGWVNSSAREVMLRRMQERLVW